MAELILKEVFYRYPGTKTDVLKGVDAVFPEGTVTAVMGRSGAGKSTMLYLLAGLDVPTGGTILYNGAALKKPMLDGYRRTEVATIAQNYLLFPTRTALENVLYPLELAKVEKNAALQEAKRHLASVGIPEELHHRLPSKLSGGVQQRVAIARALASHSNVIAADEPTGNLDEENADAVMALLKKLAHEEGKTVIVVTHDRLLAEEADRCYRIKRGKIDAEY
jgi:putative ABC transport system ATP-binding protein